MGYQEEVYSYSSCQNICSEGVYVIRQYRESIENPEIQLANNSKIRKVYRFVQTLIYHAENPIKKNRVLRTILDSLPITKQDLEVLLSVLDRIQSTLDNPKPSHDHLVAISILSEIESFCRVQ